MRTRELARKFGNFLLKQKSQTDSFESPAMSNLSYSSGNKDGILSFINTLGKKKKIKELEELEVEGKSAIDNLSVNPSIDTLPEDYILDEFEERRMIHPSMTADSGYQALKHTLVNWINDELR